MSTTTKPLHPFITTPAGGYPLALGELCALAQYWWNVAYDHGIWWTLSGTVGGSEVRVRNYALDRLDLLAETIGQDEVALIRDVVEARWRRNLGEKQWAAYKEGRAIYQEEAEERRDGVSGEPTRSGRN